MLCVEITPPPHCSTRSQVGTCSRALGFEQSVSQRGEEDLYICGGNLASKVTSAGFLDLVVTACHLRVDEEATSSGFGCLKVSATTCLVEWAAGRRKASAEIWVTDAAGAVTHPSSTESSAAGSTFSQCHCLHLLLLLLLRTGPGSTW